MDNWLPSVVAGVLLVLFGAAFCRWHFVSWQQQRHDETLSDEDRTHLYRRYRRRMKTSLVIILIGILIPVGDQVRALQRPWTFTAWVSLVLFLALWLVLMALGDIAVTRTHTRVKLSRIRREQRELEERLAEIQKRRSNGHADFDETY